MSHLKIPLYRSLRGRLLLALSVVALMSIVGLGLASYYDERAALQAEVNNQLTSIADLKKEQIITWLDERQADARLLAVNKLNQEHLTEILSSNAQVERKAEFSTFLTDNLIGMKKSRTGYDEIMFIDTGGTVILSTDSGLTGKPTEYITAFRGTLKSPTGAFTQDIHLDPAGNQPKMLFGHVIHAIDLSTFEERPEVIGIVLVTVNMEDTIYPLIHAWPGMGNTGETLLVRAEDDATLFLNNLRFDDDAALNLRVPADRTTAKPAHLATRGHEGIIQTLDYRSVPVLAAYRHIPRMGWGFVAKKDIDEAFAPARELARRVGFVAIIVLLVAVGISLAFAQTLTRPLAKLARATQTVASGNLTTKIDVSGQDEIGALAESFRTMVFSLKERQQQVLTATEVNRLSMRELEQTDTALRESDERLRRIYNAANDAILLIEPHSAEIIEANPKASQMFGYSQEELVGMCAAKLNPSEKINYKNILEEITKNNEAGQSHQLTYFTKSDDTLSTEASFSSVQIEGKLYVLAVVRDVTRRKQLEAQLRQSQKMEAIGQLAGGVAHDFNNLLTVITGYSNLLLYRIDDEEIRQDIEQIRKAGDRAAALTRQLLAFSRKQVLQPKILDLNVVVTDMEKMLRRLIGEDIELDTNLTQPLERIKADPGQVEQVIMNLAVNARDAMPDGGKLTIQTAGVQWHPPSHIKMEPGRYVLLTVSDTGMGMDDQTQARIFEPFFTTKEAGKGTGLGLATVYGIVTQSGGTIQVDSQPGNGTTFKVYLPHVEVWREESDSNTAPDSVENGSETVLLVEDETGVRSLARDILQRNGYNVLEAQNGKEALQIVQQHTAPIDLLLTDVIMPHMNGYDLARQLSNLRPAAKVVYISGYANKALNRNGGEEAGENFLQKPFTPNVLAHKIRSTLDN